MFAKILKTNNDLKQIDRTKSLCLVPTMGAIHEGHLSLVEIAKEKAEQVCVSIYVNPLQFGPNEDFKKYPRDLETDLKKLEKLKVDYVFAPLEIKISKDEAILANPQLVNCLCGLSRPGHFDGVATIVKKLFDLIKPQSAVFGEKDFQQLLIIKDLIRHYDLDIEIIQASIMRDGNGLALSSRNEYLSPKEYAIAVNIFKTLAGIRAKAFDINEARALLEGFGIEIEYLEKRWDRILFAGKIGQTRLIDNVELPLNF